MRDPKKRKRCISPAKTIHGSTISTAALPRHFLTQLYMSTAQVKWLDLAKSYQTFSMTTAECQFESKQVCKS